MNKACPFCITIKIVFINKTVRLFHQATREDAFFVHERELHVPRRRQRGHPRPPSRPSNDLEDHDPLDSSQRKICRCRSSELKTKFFLANRGKLLAHNIHNIYYTRI